MSKEAILRVIEEYEKWHVDVDCPLIGTCKLCVDIEAARKEADAIESKPVVTIKPENWMCIPHQYEGEAPCPKCTPVVIDKSSTPKTRDDITDVTYTACGVDTSDPDIATALEDVVKAAAKRLRMREVGAATVKALQRPSPKAAFDDREKLIAVVDEAADFIASNGCHSDNCRVNYGRCTCHVGEMLDKLGWGPKE